MITNLRLRGWLLRHDMNQWLEKRLMDVAWLLPRGIVKWATIRCFVHATSGKYGSTHPDSLNYSDVMKRWESEN